MPCGSPCFFLAFFSSCHVCSGQPGTYLLLLRICVLFSLTCIHPEIRSLPCCQKEVMDVAWQTRHERRITLLVRARAEAFTVVNPSTCGKDVCLVFYRSRLEVEISECLALFVFSFREILSTEVWKTRRAHTNIVGCFVSILSINWITRWLRVPTSVTLIITDLMESAELRTGRFNRFSETYALQWVCVSPRCRLCNSIWAIESPSKSIGTSWSNCAEQLSFMCRFCTKRKDFYYCASTRKCIVQECERSCASQDPCWVTNSRLRSTYIIKLNSTNYGVVWICVSWVHGRLITHKPEGFAAIRVRRLRAVWRWRWAVRQYPSIES